MADRLPLPSAEASAARSAITSTIAKLESLIEGRSQAVPFHLGSWEGQKQVDWSTQFGYSQGDLAVAIDDLQALRGQIDDRLGQIVFENMRRMFDLSD